MKQIFILLMVAMCATMFTACSKDDDKNPLDDNGEGVITMTVEGNTIGLQIYSFNEGDIITIDWGDGTVEEFKSVEIYYDWDEDGEDEIHYAITTDDYVEHEYSNRNPHIVTIKGKIKYLGCEDNNLTSLDVSGCTALTFLVCSRNNLTSSALNQIFRNLPQGKTVDNGYSQSRILIYDNPGTETCDKSIAENKGWEVNTIW